MAIEIKSSLLNDDDFKYTKESLIAVSEIDHKEQWRVKMIEYINQKANSSQDEFFYDMLPSLLFFSFQRTVPHAVSNKGTVRNLTPWGLWGSLRCLVFIGRMEQAW